MKKIVAIILALMIVNTASAEIIRTDDETMFAQGIELLRQIKDSRSIESAVDIFANISSGYNSSSYFKMYAQALEDLHKGDYANALMRLDILNGNSSFSTLLNQYSLPSCESIKLYTEGRQAEDEGSYSEAFELYSQIDILDSLDRVFTIKVKTTELTYDQAIKYFDDGEYAKAAELFESLGDYMDSAERADQAKKLVPHPISESITEDRQEQQTVPDILVTASDSQKSSKSDIHDKIAKPPVMQEDKLSNDEEENVAFVFGNVNLKRNEVRAIEFVNSLQGAADNAWDVSMEKNGSVLAWTTDEPSGIKLTIAGESGVTAPEDASYLFAGYENVTSIEFNECFYTKDTTNMKRLFDRCRKLSAVDVSNFDTSNVMNMSYMFYDCSELISLDLRGKDNEEKMHGEFNDQDTLVGCEKRGFDTSGVVDMRYMFAKCKKLERIIMSDSFILMDMDEQPIKNMFKSCPASISLNEEKIDVEKWQKQSMIVREIKKNDKGESVTWLQRVLSKLGYLSGSVDGDFGNMTETAVKAFQTAMGQNSSGIVDLQTIRCLCEEGAKQNRDFPKVGDILRFGHYEQDGDGTNGSEDIEWIVLETDGKKATMISLYGLDAVVYNNDESNTTWDRSSLRRWLNEDFLKKAFNSNEQSKLMTMSAKEEDNPKYGTNSGEATKDMIYPASIQEVTSWLENDLDRICLPTVQAIDTGVKIYGSNDACNWWLRTSGGDSDRISYVNSEGEVDYDGIFGNDSGCAVRPIITVEIKKPSANKTVTSNTGSSKKKKKRSGGSSGGSGSGGYSGDPLD